MPTDRQMLEFILLKGNEIYCCLLNFAGHLQGTNNQGDGGRNKNWGVIKFFKN